MRNGSETMEQHGCELNDQDQREEEHKDETNRLELEILLGDVNLKRRKKVLAKALWTFLTFNNY
jgi:hypothetical protein